MTDANPSPAPKYPGWWTQRSRRLFGTANIALERLRFRLNRIRDAVTGTEELLPSHNDIMAALDTIQRGVEDRQARLEGLLTWSRVGSSLLNLHQHMIMLYDETIELTGEQREVFKRFPEMLSVEGLAIFAVKYLVGDAYRECTKLLTILELRTVLARAIAERIAAETDVDDDDPILDVIEAIDSTEFQVGRFHTGLDMLDVIRATANNYTKLMAGYEFLRAAIVQEMNILGDVIGSYEDLATMYTEYDPSSGDVMEQLLRVVWDYTSIDYVIDTRFLRPPNRPQGA